MSIQLPTAPPLPQPFATPSSREGEPRNAMARMAREGSARLVLCFGGQAQRWWEDLEELYGIPESRAVIEACTEAMTDELERGLHPHGLDLLR
jgi:hypothetical protein